MLIRHLKGFVQLPTSGHILDIGGSTGLVAQAVSAALGGQATVIDPALAELELAKARGLQVVHGFVEDWQPSQQYDLVLLCRSIEHLYNLDATLTKIRDLLTPDGLFFVDIVDFMAYCRKLGSPELVSRVDHCYWLSFETAEQYFAKLGFVVAYAFNIEVSGDWSTIGYILRKRDLRHLPVDTMSMMVEIKQIETAWHTFLRPPNAAFRTSYLAYRRLIPKKK